MWQLSADKKPAFAGFLFYVAPRKSFGFCFFNCNAANCARFVYHLP
ncbi:hypothetical protein SAMN04515618_111110 [Collimonas sp. OK307]|nr:hypothetical protein SAMN04515618_111110 [Collimonas sp. OK307]